MALWDQQRLALFLLELKRHRKIVATTQAHQQRTIITFFCPSLILMLQVNQGLRKWAPNQDTAKRLQ